VRAGAPAPARSAPADARTEKLVATARELAPPTTSARSVSGGSSMARSVSGASSLSASSARPGGPVRTPSAASYKKPPPPPLKPKPGAGPPAEYVVALYDFVAQVRKRRDIGARRGC
jgi:amphiphysin